MIFKGFWLLKNLLTGKTISHVLKNSFSRRFKTLELISVGSSKFYYVKGQDNHQTQQLILIYTKVNNYLNSWTKFPLNNRKPSKALKFNRELSKLPLPPIETLY